MTAPVRRVVVHPTDLVLERRCRGQHGTRSAEFRCWEHREAPRDADADVSWVDGGVEAAADVGEEHEEQVVVRGKRLAPGEARPGERSDDDESGWRAWQRCVMGFAETDDVLLQALDVLRVQGECAAGEPWTVL